MRESEERRHEKEGSRVRLSINRKRKIESCYVIY